MVLLVVGLLLQRTVLHVAAMGSADLVTVLVAVLGLYAGPVAGCLSGFGIGFGADRFPTTRSAGSRPCSASSATCAG